jgi:hypothetical protein
MTANGKLDTKALPAPEERTDKSGEMPHPGLEAELAEIWQDILQREAIPRDADFFALGGHSLLVTRIAARIASQHGYPATPRLLFDYPTIAALAQALLRLPSAAMEEGVL